MISFRDAFRDADPRAEIRALHRAAEDGDATTFLVEAGELEQGVVDALRTERGGWGPLEQALRAVSSIAGEAYVAAAAGCPADSLLARAREALDAIPVDALPARIRIKAPEGYLHYALDPADFAAAARRYAADAGDGRAARAVVIGVRSIGTSLSAVVAAALGTGRTFTIRPRGPSGARRVDVDAALGARIRAWLADGGDVLVADEGPGATGETFWSIARWLREMGVDDERIILLPSGDGAMPLAPEERRAWFNGARRYAPEADADRVRRVAERLGISDLEDLSWGAWRQILPQSAHLPAAPIHERLKFRGTGPDGRAYLIRYAGLGRWGAEAVDRARVLADAGAGPAVLGAADGFVALRWVDGRPIRPEDRGDADVREAVRAYLAARAGRFPTGGSVDRAPIIAALCENAREALGDRPPGLDEAIRRIEHLPERAAVVPDGRLQAHEWIRGAHGITKVDAMDHGAGTRLPGPADAAWDLAGAAVEWILDAASLSALIAGCAAASGDDPRVLADAVAAYRAPYAAACLGEATFACWEAGSDDERRVLEAEAARYRAALAAALAI